MIRMISTAAFAVALAIVPVAQAQMSGQPGARPAPSYDRGGSPYEPGNDAMPAQERPSRAERRQGQGYTVPPDLRGSVQERMGRNQRALELVQTTLLNRLASAGVTEMRDFQKQGERYVAEIRTQDGQWRTVQVDPFSGEIAEVTQR